ncbi:MAG: GntR family transcriptional regulator [Acidobacteria bacterium]|nr:GntR family transcriptional regulator [Acidobacteriota bacterium]MCW5970682.1 GntR family transcriptional regulator [Blastocatellales bacterium]
MTDSAAQRYYRELPRYIQITESIRQQITSGALAPHSKLPSEFELMKTYGVARATIRQALAKLQEEGLTYSRRAVGSFVAEPRVHQDLDHLFSFTEFMAYRGLKASSKLLQAEVIQLSSINSPILSELKLRVGERVVFVQRLRLGNNQPLVIANTYLPESRFPDFLANDLERKSVYEIMETRYGLKPDDAIQTFEAATLESADASLLGVAPLSPALLITRVGYAKGVPVEYATDYYRGDRTRFRVRLGVID